MTTWRTTSSSSCHWASYRQMEATCSNSMPSTSKGSSSSDMPWKRQQKWSGTCKLTMLTIFWTLGRGNWLWLLGLCSSCRKISLVCSHPMAKTRSMWSKILIRLTCPLESLAPTRTKTWQASTFQQMTSASWKTHLVESISKTVILSKLTSR